MQLEPAVVVEMADHRKTGIFELASFQGRETQRDGETWNFSYVSVRGGVSLYNQGRWPDPVNTKMFAGLDPRLQQPAT